MIQELTFNRSNVVNRNTIRVNVPYYIFDELRNQVFLPVCSGITKKVMDFRYDPFVTEQECMEHEGWDGEESHLFFIDTENKNITLDVWFSANVDVSGDVNYRRI